MDVTSNFHAVLFLKKYAKNSYLVHKSTMHTGTFVGKWNLFNTNADLI